MRAKPFVIVALAMSIICTSGAALACAYPERSSGGDPMMGVASAYEQILRKYGARPGEAGRIAGKQGEADVRFAVTYETYEDRQRRAKELGQTLLRLDEAMRATLGPLQAARASLADAASATPADPKVPRLDADDRSALADLTRRIEAIEQKLRGKKKPLEDEWQALDRQANELRQRLLETLSSACPADVPAASIGGTWTAMTFTYTITQTGKTFTWTNPGIGGETATGTIDGTTVKASWKGGRFGDGSGTGRVVVEGGRAVRIEWSNGVVFLRK